MAELSIEGKLIRKFKPVKITKDLEKQEFVIEADSNGYPNPIPFQLFKDKIKLIKDYKKGDVLKVHFNLKGNSVIGQDGEERWFTNATAWKIEAAESTPTAPDDGWD